jgi:hypothetical protein
MTKDANANKFNSNSLEEILLRYDLLSFFELKFSAIVPKKYPIIAPGNLKKLNPKKANNHFDIINFIPANLQMSF